MAANSPGGPGQQIGSDASPIVIGAGGSKTWTHSAGQRAARISALTVTDRVPVAAASLTVTQPSANAITLASTPGVSCILLVEWELPSLLSGAAKAASAFV